MAHMQAHAVAMYSVRAASLPIALVAVINSLLLILAHARDNKHPALRVYTVRILLLVIIDCVAAVSVLWSTGWSPKADPYVHSVSHFVCELYESVVIFSFLQFVLVCGGGAERLAAKFAKRADCGQQEAAGAAAAGGSAAKRDVAPEWAEATAARAEDEAAAAAAAVEEGVAGEGMGAQGVEAEASLPQVAQTQSNASRQLLALELSETPKAEPRRELHHLPGFSYVLPPWRSGEQMLRWCVTGTLAYVVVGASLAVLGIILLLFPGSGQIKQVIWEASSFLLSAAQATAIMSLAELAVNVKEEISLLRPYGKFLSVKFVVFFAFWQGLLLQGLLRLGVFTGFEHGCGADCAATIIQNMLICIEMLAASIIHFYVFPPHDYLRLLAQNRLHYGEASPGSLGSPPTLAEVVDVRDIFRTAWQVHVTANKSSAAGGGAKDLEAVEETGEDTSTTAEDVSRTATPDGSTEGTPGSAEIQV